MAIPSNAKTSKLKLLALQTQVVYLLRIAEMYKMIAPFSKARVCVSQHQFQLRLRNALGDLIVQALEAVKTGLVLMLPKQ